MVSDQDGALLDFWCSCIVPSLLYNALAPNSQWLQAKKLGLTQLLQKVAGPGGEKLKSYTLCGGSIDGAV